MPDPAPRTISIVIPCLNDAHLLRRCLASLHAQETPADEIIVV
ncbi:MAG TPA: glycosyltransferase, partial [Corynebacterium pollutisoli]|nr:glycosyltransferase [Corynebacterium pollutisoli]